MKKAIILGIFVATFVLLSAAQSFALDVNVQNNNTNLVLMKDFNNQSVTFNVSVTNNGPSDSFTFFNLVGFLMEPSQPVYIAQGETKTVNITITPVSELSYTGYYTFNYYIQSSSGDRNPESVTFRIASLDNAFSVGASEINPKSNSITIYIKNGVNFNFQNLNVNFKSPFFTPDKQVSLAPYEQKSFEVTLNKDDFKSLLAGFYTLSADISSSGKSGTVEGNIKFSEQDILNVSEQNNGFIIFTKVIEKKKQRNVVPHTQTTVTKNDISRLFTTFSPEPDTVKRNGFNVDYTWDSRVQPGDTLRIEVKTNWLWPLFVVLFIIAIVILVKQFSKTSLTMDKKVSFLRAKGGEFAVKVTIVVSAKKFVERLTINERLPPLVKLYEKFGVEKPSRVDEKNKKLEWYFDQLEAGETRVLSFVLYSKVGVLGRFALPTAAAIFERNGKISEAESNRAFLVAEQSREPSN